MRHALSLWLIGFGLLTHLIGAPAAGAQTSASPAPGQEPKDAAGRLVVGTKEAPPFAMRAPDGSWTGISVELWDRIAGELQLNYELRDMTLDALLNGLENGEVHVGVAALTVTAEREELLDFTHPFFSSGLGIAVPQQSGGRWLSTARSLLSLQLLSVIAGLALLLVVVGLLVWTFEHRGNPEQFGNGRLRGIGSAFWWAAVTMTTVGYGDKAPATPMGRLLAIIWMFAGIILIATFTAAITSALTVSQLDARVQGPEDLPSVRVATVASTTSENYLRSQGIRPRTYPSPNEALAALERDEADAVVYDRPILRYLVTGGSGSDGDFTSLRVLPSIFESQNYAIGLSTNSPIREQINRALLRHTQDRTWGEMLRRYLGD